MNAENEPNKQDELPKTDAGAEYASSLAREATPKSPLPVRHAMDFYGDTDPYRAYHRARGGRCSGGGGCC